MADLFITEPVSLRTKRRAFRIEIENPMGVENKSIAYHQEDVQVTEAGAPVSSKSAGSIRIPFMDLATTMYTIIDPVTQTEVTFSGAAIALWLEEDYVTKATAALA